VDFVRAIEHRTQQVAIAKEVGDRAGEGGAYGNLGNAYLAQGAFSEAIEHNTQQLAIAQEADDGAGKCQACTSLGGCHVSASGRASMPSPSLKDVMVKKLGLAKLQSYAALVN
jgi:cytochrome c2